MPLLSIAENRLAIIRRMRSGGELAQRLIRKGEANMVAKWNPEGQPEMSLSKYTWGVRAFQAAKRMLAAGEIIVVSGSLEGPEANLLAGPNFPKEVQVMAEESAPKAPADTKQEALDKIIELSRPGQTLDIGSAIDVLCDIWNIARAAQ